jgi:hypothetical protein
MRSAKTAHSVAASALRSSTFTLGNPTAHPAAIEIYREIIRKVRSAASDAKRLRLDDRPSRRSDLYRRSGLRLLAQRDWCPESPGECGWPTLRSWSSHIDHAPSGFADLHENRAGRLRPRCATHPGQQPLALKTTFTCRRAVGSLRGRKRRFAKASGDSRRA